MKTYFFSWLVATALVGVAISRSGSDAKQSNRPATVSSIRSAALLDRGATAVTAYMNACAEGNQARLHATLDDDAAIEFPEAEPGTFLLIDAANAAEFCATRSAAGAIRSLRMYRTGEQAMFASFLQDGDTPHLVLIDLRGSRILRLRDFSVDTDRVTRYAAGQLHNKLKEPS